MTTNTIQAINELVATQLNFLQKVGELNLKTVEALGLKQSELLKNHIDFGSQYVEFGLKRQALSAEQKPVNELLSTWGEKWQTHWRETAEIFKAYYAEFNVTAEASFKAAQAGTTQLIEAGKQAATEATEKTKVAVESATAEVIDLGKTAAAQASETVKKVANKA